MKKLFSAILFLLPTLAMAIDKPIPCSGNSCKLLFETTGSGGAKVSAGNVDGVGKWTLGSDAITTAGGEMLSLRASATNSRVAVRGYQNNVTKWLVGSSTVAGDMINGDAAGDLAIVSYGAALNFSGNSGTTKHGSLSSAGAWSIGTASQIQTIVGSFLKINNASLPIGTVGGMYFVFSATSETCDTKCLGATPTGLNSASGACLKAWNSSGNPQACTVTSTNQYCFCVGIP